MSDVEYGEWDNVTTAYQDPNAYKDYNLLDTEADYDFQYGRAPQVDLTEAYSVFLEKWNKDGSLKQRQTRNTAGQFGPNIVSRGKRNQELKRAMETILTEALLQNYDRLVKGVAEPTGTLRRAVATGLWSDEDNFENFAMVFQLANLQRVRERSFSGYGGGGKSTSTNMTSLYGPVIFNGRRAISSSNPMMFPGYAGGPRVVKTNMVRGVMPANIYELSPGQVSALTASVMRPIQDIIADNIRAAE